MRIAYLAALVLLITVSLTAEEPKKEKMRFTIGKKTTVVDGPLDADGRIDYSAAVNAILSKGVTSKNNANVLFWQAMGPNPEGRKSMAPEYFQAMDMAAPPEQGVYFIDDTKFLRDNGHQFKGQDDPIHTALQECRSRPWKEVDHPRFAAWLKANEKPLALVVEGTKRDAYYNPLIPTKGPDGSNGMISCLLPNVQKCRGFASALVMRAMLRLQQGDAKAAWADLQACHRLGRHVGQGGSLIEHLVGIAINSIACQGDLAFLQHSGADGKMLEECMKDLQNLKPLPALAAKIQTGERLMMLDIMMMVDRSGLKKLSGADDSNPLIDEMMKTIDWDPAMELSNQWYDRITKILEIRDPQERAKQFAEFIRDLKAMKAQAADGEGITAALLKGKPAGKELGKKIGEIFVSLMFPAIDKVSFADDRMIQLNDNVLIAFALARYKLDNQRYPASLDDLAPKYLNTAPRDLFSGKPLIYKPTADGYTFYSVGTNFKDDEGRGLGDTPPGDDLTVRMPMKN